MKLSGSNLKPKHHFMLHYSEIIRKIGPLKTFWTMRFESKHRMSKNICKNINNFKNITKSVAQRYALGFASLMQNEFQNNESGLEFSGSKYRILKHSEQKVFLMSALNLSDNDSVLFHRKCEVNGFVLQKDMLFVRTWSENGPVISKVLDIFTNNSDSNIMYIDIETTEFWSHFNAYITGNKILSGSVDILNVKSLSPF